MARTLRHGERRVHGHVMYSSAFLDDAASTSVSHARWQEAWATCYMGVLAVPRALRLYAPSFIREFFMWSGVTAWIVVAIFLYGMWLR